MTRDADQTPLLRRGSSVKLLLALALGRRAREERGQAMPLAAIGIFAMCLGVLVTMNLGQAVHQKIKLQNTADSAAYTLAAMEARTFNYIAFLNRAQIAHYNTAMVVQSYITWVGFHVALFNTAYDLLVSLHGAVLYGLSTCKSYECIPWKAANIAVRAMLMGYVTLATTTRRAYKEAENIGHKIVHAMTIFNDAAVWQSQAWRAMLMNVHLMTGVQNYIEKNDPDIKFGKGKRTLLNTVVNSAMNSIEYYQTFDKGGGVNPFFLAFLFHQKRITPSGEYRTASDDDSKEAWRVMTELSNASRSPRFVSMRFGGASKSAAVVSVTGAKMGQTRFSSSGSMNNARIASIYSDGNYAVGKSLSSNDFMPMTSGTGMMMGSVTYMGTNTVGDAVAAYRKTGKHYRYKVGKTPKKSGTISQGYAPSRIGIILSPGPTVPNKMTEKTSCSGLKWEGMAPFFMFKAKGDRTKDYNQPSTWIFLTKHHEDFQTKWGSFKSGKAPMFGKFSFTHGARTVKLDLTTGGSQNSYMFEGLNVISRGMAYYHRPGPWTEHPNFFNPFWRARLAPVGQKLQNFWDRWVSSKITSSSDSKFVKGAVNFLRNAQMDLFTSAITSIITH